MFSASDLNNLVVEGPGEKFLTNGKEVLNLRSRYEPGLHDFWDKQTEGGTNGVILKNSDINGELERLCEQDTPELCDSFRKKGNFKGGHITVWLPQKFPKNIKIKFDMQSVTPLGLFILFFAASPKKDPSMSIFDESLPTRNGIYTQYTIGKINNYGISYSARFTGSPRNAPAKLRKNTGAKQISKGKDIAAEKTGVWYSIKMVKRGKKIRFYIDNQLVINYKAKRKSDMHGAGYIGLRQMASGHGKYKNFEVYR